MASFMILASVLITCQMIFIRAVLGQSTIWQTEAVIYLMIGATMIGLAYVQKLKGHVGVDLIPTMLGPKGRRIMAIFHAIFDDDDDGPDALLCLRDVALRVEARLEIRNRLGCSSVDSLFGHASWLWAFPFTTRR